MNLISIDEDIITRTIISLEWMTTDIKWRADETKLNFEEGSKEGYSPQLQDALDLLEELLEIELTEHFNGIIQSDNSW